jgi:DNA excision repair protein ERCC-3
MSIDPANPLIVQSDRTLLLDVHAPKAEAARAAIMPFAELEKSPEHIHTFRISPLSLWNAASAGFSPQDIAAVLDAYSRYAIPQGILEAFADTMARYGKIRLLSAEQLVRERSGPADPDSLGADPANAASADAAGEGASGAEPAIALDPVPALPEELFWVTREQSIAA